MMKTALKNYFLPRKQHALLERDSFGNAKNLCFTVKIVTGDAGFSLKNIYIYIYFFLI